MPGRILIVSLLVCALATFSCTRGDSAEGVGDQFVETYYIQVNQAEATEYAAGLARERLQAELQQVTPLRRGNTLDQARPRATYSRARTQPEGRQVLLTYDLTITPMQGGPIRKTVLLITEQVGERWKVVNFAETDAPPNSQ